MPRPYDGDTSDAGFVDGILTQATSDLVDDTSSETNKRLADSALEWARHTKRQVYAQGEVGRLLERGVGDGALIARTRTQAEARKDKLPYLDTQAVALLQNTFCKRHGWKIVIPIAPFPHVWRVIWVYRRLGLKLYIPGDIKCMVWGEELEQEQWRRPWKAYRYEFFARLFYWYKGYI